MGREATIRKTRLCKECKEFHSFDAEGLTEHADLCKRASSINLTLSGTILNPRKERKLWLPSSVSMP